MSIEHKTTRLAGFYPSSAGIGVSSGQPAPFDQEQASEIGNAGGGDSPFSLYLANVVPLFGRGAAAVEGGAVPVWFRRAQIYRTAEIAVLARRQLSLPYPRPLFEALKRVIAPSTSIELGFRSDKILSSFDPTVAFLHGSGVLEEDFHRAKIVLAHEFAHIDQLFPKEFPEIGQIRKAVEEAVGAARESGVLEAFFRDKDRNARHGGFYGRFCFFARQRWPELAHILEAHPLSEMQTLLLPYIATSADFIEGVTIPGWTPDRFKELIDDTLSSSVVFKEQRRIPVTLKNRIRDFTGFMKFLEHRHPNLHSILQKHTPNLDSIRTGHDLHEFLLARAVLEELDTPRRRASGTAIYARTLGMWKELKAHWDNPEIPLMNAEIEAHTVSALVRRDPKKGLLQHVEISEFGKTAPVPDELQDIERLERLFAGDTKESREFLAELRRDNKRRVPLFRMGAQEKVDAALERMRISPSGEVVPAVSHNPAEVLPPLLVRLANSASFIKAMRGIELVGAATALLEPLRIVQSVNDSAETKVDVALSSAASLNAYVGTGALFYALRTGATRVAAGSGIFYGLVSVIDAGKQLYDDLNHETSSSEIIANGADLAGGFISVAGAAAMTLGLATPGAILSLAGGVINAAAKYGHAKAQESRIENAILRSIADENWDELHALVKDVHHEFDDNVARRVINRMSPHAISRPELKGFIEKCRAELNAGYVSLADQRSLEMLRGDWS